jgi:hypothetical protein
MSRRIWEVPETHVKLAALSASHPPPRRTRPEPLHRPCWRRSSPRTPVAERNAMSHGRRRCLIIFSLANKGVFVTT